MSPSGIEQAKIAAVAPVANSPTTSKHTASSSSLGRSDSARQQQFRMAASVGTKPTPIKVGPMQFLIMDTPRPNNLHLYIKEMRKHSITDVVRVCEQTYHGAELEQAGILLHEMEYPDGQSPPAQLIDQWLQLVESRFYKNKAPAEASSNAGGIAIHCVAGLGRAPVMIAIALIEFANMDAIDAVHLIRQHRRGAINEKQLLYLEGYKRSYHRRHGGAAGGGGCCVVM